MKKTANKQQNNIEVAVEIHCRVKQIHLRIIRKICNIILLPNKNNSKEKWKG